MSKYYEAQETAMAQGISGAWPEVIKAPHTKHGRLKLMDYDPVEKIESLKRDLAEAVTARDEAKGLIAHWMDKSDKSEASLAETQRELEASKNWVENQKLVEMISAQAARIKELEQFIQEHQEEGESEGPNP